MQGDPTEGEAPGPEGQEMPPQDDPEQGGLAPGEQEHDPVDLEGAIADALETGCQLATAATGVSAEDFMRFSQGVHHLADALAAIQPKADPAAVQLAIAQMNAQQQAEQQENRPTEPQSSDRG